MGIHHRDTPALRWMARTKERPGEPFSSCVKRCSFACRAVHLAVWLVVFSTDLCGVSKLWPGSQTLSRQCRQGPSAYVRISSHTAPTEKTDKSSASHYCKLKINDQIDSRLALARLGTRAASRRLSRRFLRVFCPAAATLTCQHVRARMYLRMASLTFKARCGFPMVALSGPASGPLWLSMRTPCSH